MIKYKGTFIKTLTLEEKIRANPDYADYYMMMDKLQKLPPEELREILEEIE